MTIATPESLDITPITNTGSGLTVPIAKAMAHLFIIDGAIARDEWAFTQADATTELNEALAHLRDLVIRDDLMTAELAEEIRQWQEQLTVENAGFTGNNSDEPPTEEQAAVITNLIRATWQLLALIDTEITGLPSRDVDPGRQP